MFLGLALATVLGPSSQTLLAIGLFAGLGVIFVIAVDRFLKTWDLPPIVFPYCLTFWSFQLLTQASTAWTFIPSTLAASPFEQEWTQALFGSLMGFGQIFFSNDWKTAVAIFLTVMVFARRNAAFIAASALLPSALCFAVLGPHWVITSGLTAFGGVLLAHAHLGGVLPLTPWQIWSLIGVSGFLEVLGVQLAQTLHVYLISGGYVFTFWIARLCIETKQSRSQSAGATMTW
jgi:urea transporter